jgi:hypothetical protein
VSHVEEVTLETEQEEAAHPPTREEQPAK